MSDVRAAAASAARYTERLMNAWLSVLADAPIDGIFKNVHNEIVVHLKEHSTPERRKDAGVRLRDAFKNWMDTIFGGEGKMDEWIAEHSAEYARVNTILGKVITNHHMSECMEQGVHTLELVRHAMAFVVAIIRSLTRAAIRALPDVVVMQTDVCSTLISGSCRARAYIEHVYDTSTPGTLPDRDTLPKLEDVESEFTLMRRQAPT